MKAAILAEKFGFHAISLALHTQHGWNARKMAIYKRPAVGAACLLALRAHQAKITILRAFQDEQKNCLHR